ncbi:MAG: Mur ligase domain-containing protein, partial [Flavobacteriaceae bacterium]
MIQLKDILYKVAIDKVIGDTSVVIGNIEFDSRKVGLNDVFVAIKGTLSDGHDYIKKASDQGAIVIICEAIPKDIINGIT